MEILLFLHHFRSPLSTSLLSALYSPLIYKCPPASDYCKKGFYSVLLQDVVDSQNKFWYYDFGWAGSIHDWNLFKKSDFGKITMSGTFLPYKLIGDAAYSMRPWFYSPFKGENVGLQGRNNTGISFNQTQ